MDSLDRKILSVTCYGHFLSHCNMLVFPAVLLPLAGRMQLDMAATLDLGFWMYLLFGLTALPWGVLADRMGARQLLFLFYGGAGLCGLLAASQVDSPAGFSLALAGIGLFSGIYHPAGLGWIARSATRLSTAMAYNGMFGNLGLAVGPLLAGLVHWWFGAAAVYISLGVLNLFGLVLLVRAGNTDSSPRQVKTEATTVASWPRFALLLVAMMLGGMVYRGTTVILPALFAGSCGDLYQLLPAGMVSINVMATSLVSLLYLLGMLGQYTGGLAGGRYDLRWTYLVFHLITIPPALGMAALTNFSLVAAATLHSFFLLGMQPVENTLVARLTPPSMHSMAYGMKFVLTFGVGSLAVKLVKHTENSLGINSVYPVLGLVSLALVLAIALLIQTTPPMRSR